MIVNNSVSEEENDYDGEGDLLASQSHLHAHRNYFVNKDYNTSFILDECSADTVNDLLYIYKESLLLYWSL